MSNNPIPSSSYTFNVVRQTAKKSDRIQVHRRSPSCRNKHLTFGHQIEIRDILRNTPQVYGFCEQVIPVHIHEVGFNSPSIRLYLRLSILSPPVIGAGGTGCSSHVQYILKSFPQERRCVSINLVWPRHVLLKCLYQTIWQSVMWQSVLGKRFCPLLLLLSCSILELFWHSLRVFGTYGFVSYPSWIFVYFILICNHHISFFCRKMWVVLKTI